MKRKEFLASLNLAKPCLGNNKTVPILSNFCLSGNTIVSYNNYEGITTEYDHGLDCCVEGELLINILSSYDTEDIDIKQEQEYISIKSGKSEVKLPIIPVKEFISPFSQLVDTVEYTINMDNRFVDGLSKCLVSSGKEKFKEEEYGVTLKIDTKGVNMYSHDGRRVSKYVYSPNTPSNLNVIDIILTPFLCSQIVNKVSQDMTGVFYIGGKAVTGDFGTFKIMSLIKPIDPNRKPILPLDFEGKVFSKYDVSAVTFVDMTKEFTSALSRAGVLFQNSRDKTLAFESVNGLLKIIGTTSIGSINEEVELKLENVKFNADLTILDILNNVTKIGTIITGGTVLLVGSDEDAFITLIATE